MDERHWWIAGRIQESFHIGGFDSPTLLEDFMCQPDTLDMINQFLHPGGPCRLFFYCDKADPLSVTSSSPSARQLHIVDSLARLKEVDLNEVSVLYLLRHNVDVEVDLTHMEKDVFCGELKGNAIESLNSLLAEIYIPLLRAQKDWGHCSDEGQSAFLHSLDKAIGNLGESSAASNSSKHVMLKHPESPVGTEFKQHRLAALDQHIISEYEQLVTDWMSTIEQILTDTSDERFMDPNAGPLSELDRWKRRQRLLTSVMEQLKGKECKAVIGVLITAKSRLLKKWKLIDSAITDAMNETKDKVRYLESLKRHLDQLYHGASPSSIINVALPGLLQCIKQMESVSRFYARQGFLGLLFTKVTNQIVLACKDYIQQCTINEDDEDTLWERVMEEIQSRDASSADPQHRHFHSLLESKLKSSMAKEKKKKPRSDGQDATLFGRLKSCLTLQSYYRDAIRSMRDSLGASYNLSHFTSMSSLTPGTSSVRSKVGGSQLGGKRHSTQGSPTKKSGAGSVFSADNEGHGVSVADEQTILSHLDQFCARLREILDVVNTLAQYNKLTVSAVGLPRPRQEDLEFEEPPEWQQKKEQAEREAALAAATEASSEPPEKPPVPNDTSRKLGAIAEDAVEEVEEEEGSLGQGDAPSKSEQLGHADEAHTVVNPSTGLTRQDITLLKNYYPEDNLEEGPSINSIIEDYMNQMLSTMTDTVTTKTMLDVESADKERFEDIYTSFQGSAHDLEKFLAAYLHVAFVRKMKTLEALDLMTRFTSIQQRPGIRLVVSEKFVEIFNWYEGDLEDIQQLYEKHKEEPPVLRDAPPVAGVIYWSRQLLKRIEEPMKVFRDNRAITHLKDFSRIVKIYNRLATALVTFESLWFTHWKTNIEQACNGLRATLFVLHPETGDIMVNADKKVLALIQEARWLTRMNIQIPEPARHILDQESRFKKYKDHLEQCLVDFKDVCGSVPKALQELFEPHVQATLATFQPGLSTLAWNSMNIDAFLHQVHAGISKLRFLVSRVNDIMSSQVEATIERVREMIFFDYQMAFSRSWPPEEFTTAMNDSINEKSDQLCDHISTIEAAIKECANILTSKKLRSGMASRERFNTTPGQTTSSKATFEEDEIVAGLLAQYNDQIYEAILIATSRTLVTLAESSGCEGEVIRATSALSDAPSTLKRSSEEEGTSTRSHSVAQSRASSAKSETSCPVSILSILSNMTWSTDKTNEVTYLRFEVEVKFCIPNITIEPALESIQTSLNTVAHHVLQVASGVTWCGADNLGDTYLRQINNDQVIDELLGQVSGVVEELQAVVKQHLLHFGMHNFLWKDDMYGNYYEFIQHNPGIPAVNREVERLLKVEKKVCSIPSILPVGPICLHTDAIKDALHGFAMAWKNQYASVLHEEAKRKLDAAVLYRSNVRQRLELTVVNLDQLNSTLHLLEELHDMENKIDDIYLPIENMYTQLREFELRLPRHEVEEVDELRDRWQELLELAEQVGVHLLKERRSAFEQELDKQVKSFVVEVIQFRNAFDAQGPAVPGIPPAEAVQRLQDFQQRYTLYNAKRQTLDSVSKLFGIPCKPFPELDKTGEELILLGMLYGLFQKFIHFDRCFRDTLWAEVDLEEATAEVESYWDECLALPSKLKDWDAYNDMKSSIQQYRDVFPLLHKLASKEIRNRHWLQVMSVTGNVFQLEANVFKLSHLLDIALIKHRFEIEEICRSASRELELEVKLRMTEDEWTEQVLVFENYKRRGPMFLDKTSTECLLEQLEDAQALLAQMLTSRYIGPLREEAASWAEKLKEVREVLEIWLEVQDMWHYLEAVFSNQDAAKDLPQEAKRFARIDKGWTKMMKRAFDTRNVLQCCYGEEVPKAVMLRHIYQELEVCFKSLTAYLDAKRHQFPRFYFVSDPILLAILSRPNDLDSVRPHLRSLFSAIHDVRLEKIQISDTDSDTQSEHREGGPPRSSSQADRARTSSVMSSQTPTKIDKRLTQVHEKDRDANNNAGVKRNKKRTGTNIHPNLTSQHVSSMLPSELALDDTVSLAATAVLSSEGESLVLQDKVALEDGVEVWLSKLHQSVNQTLHDQVLQIAKDINSGMPCDEWPLKYPTQVCQLGLLYHWTKECDQVISEIKYERKALFNYCKRYGSVISRLPTVLARGAWKNIEEAMMPVHRLRLENMITQSLFLRDTIDNMCNRKLRESTDFEWRRNLRCHIHEVDSKPEPCLFMLEQRFLYGCEFYGAQALTGMTPHIDKCFLAMSQAVGQCKGAIVTGGTGVGKTETVKGFAQSLGQFVMMFQCRPQSSASALGRLVQGLAMDGCWGCFDEIQNLGQEGMAVLMDHVQAVLAALKSGRDYCFIGDGQEITVKRQVAMFMTYNSTTASLPTAKLPVDLQAMFRQVSLVKPDPCLVLKAKCSSLQLKSPSVLALRLKLVAELAQDQLSADAHHSLSTTALAGVLQRASQLRRSVREEKSAAPIERMEKKISDLQDSRSNSVMSTAPSQPGLLQQSSTLTDSRPGQKTAGGRKANTPNPLTAAAKIDHAIVGQCLLDIVGPRLSQENYAIFRQIVRDIFCGLPEPPASLTSAVSSQVRMYDLEAAIEDKASDSGLITHKPWMDKCMQLYSVSLVHQGIIIAGPPGSGKSSVTQTLVDALCATPRGMSRGSSRSRTSTMAETSHKLQKLYPLVVDDLSLIFGSLNQNNDWVDGIFTSAWRKACRNQSTTWLCLDGPINGSWADRFTSVLDGSKTLNLANGDQLFMSPNVKLLFETGDLSDASPSIVSRTGIVYIDKQVVDWKPIAKAWLQNRTQQEVHVLQRAFNKTVDPISSYVLNDCKCKLKLSEVGMFQTCINLLSAMLADNIELGGELHIERLYLFCLMWTFGGLLDEKERRGFDDLIKTLSTALPDDDRDICFFDYYVDESGEWDPWHSRVPEAVYSDSQNVLGEVFVDTVDTIRSRLLMEFACASGQNVLLVGPSGSGKTAMINDFLDTQDPQAQVTKKLVYSGSSAAKQLQQFVETNIYHRQGFVYGAKDQKKLQLFIDDLNLPSPDQYGVQRCNELMRRLLDDKVLCTLQKPFEWWTVEGLNVLSTMSLSDHPSMNNGQLSERLLRHFAVLSLPAQKDEELKSIVKAILEMNMAHGDQPGLQIELRDDLVKASCMILGQVKQVLRPTPMPGRAHYMFSLKDIVRCFQCLRRLADESRENELMVVSLWCHEVERVIKDSICRFADMKWFEDTMNDVIQQNWPDFASSASTQSEEGEEAETDSSKSLHKNFVTFPIDARMYQRPVTSLSKKETKILLQPVDDLSDVHTCLQTHLTRYNEEFGNVSLNIMLSNNIISHVVKMHRVLSYHHGGNFLCVGSIGSHLGTLCKLALHVADIPIHNIDSSKQNTFFDGLRSAVRLTGAEGKKLTLFFTGRDLHDDLYLDAINSVLVSGEYPHLFTNDEMDGLLQALGPAMKREHPNVSVDPTKFFISRIRTNLHIIICLPPKHKLLRTAANQYPGLLSGCQLIWICDWTKESLLGEAAYFLNKHSLTRDCESDHSENIVTCLANIHSFVLDDCRQMGWVGDTNDDVNMTAVKFHEKKKDQLKTVSQKMANRPYSKAILLENIKLGHRDLDVPTSSELFVGPTTFYRFMNTFRSIYMKKAKERSETMAMYQKAIKILKKTRVDAKSMKEDIRSIQKQFEGAKQNTAELLTQLTTRATVLEKLKAKSGEATSLNAFLQMNEMSDEEEEGDDLLEDEERDEYDAEFERMREANLKTRSVQAVDEHADAVKMVEECREKLKEKKTAVLQWKSKVDRQCIERLKNFQNPPMLVGFVMEMIMTLIGKKSTSDRLERRDNYPSKDEHSGHFSASSGSTKITSVGRRAKPAEKGSERFDRAQWKMMQQTMNDTQKFVDMLHNVPWEDGLSDDVVMAVESYLARSKEGKLGGVTGEGTMLENVAETEKSFVPQRRSPSPENTHGITIKSAKYSSEDAATLTMYAIAIVEFTQLCGPLKAAMERVHDLQREIQENERLKKKEEEEPVQEKRVDTPVPEEELNPEDQPRVQSEVDNLQQQFDAAVMEKHELEMKLVSMCERLKAASDMTESLKSQEKVWKESVEEFPNNDVLVANCITAAAFLTYGGGMNTDRRVRMGEFFLKICQHNNIPLASQQLFKNVELFDFLSQKIDVKQLELLNLPCTRLMLENAAFITQGDTTLAWPLLCDPACRVTQWLGSFLESQNLMVIRYSELRSQFDTCLAEGLPLLVMDVDVQAFVRDPRFAAILHSRHQFVPDANPFKVAVGDHEVECRPSFRLYLHTSSSPHEVPAELAAYVSVQSFQQSRHDVEEELLDRFMRLEKSRLEEERAAILQEKLENLQQLDKLEKHMLKELSSDVSLLDNLQCAKKLADLKKQYDEKQDSLYQLENSEASFLRARESFRTIALRGAVCYNVAQYMHVVDSLYRISFQQFLDLFDAAISHSDRAAVKAIVDRLTQTAFLTVVRSLKEMDKPLYSLLLALEIEDSLGRLGLGEREFLISPSFGSVTMTAAGKVQQPDSKFVTAKKPFDWMTDDQFNNLQILAIHYDWFQDMFDRMPKDGRETQWRTLCESDQPELQPLPDKMDEHYNALQRLLVIRAVRSDRLIQLTTLYVQSVLGKKYAGEISLDLPLVLRQSSPQTPILLLYTKEQETAEKVFSDFAQRKQNKTLVVPLSGLGSAQERMARRYVQKGMTEGLWVLLQNGHNSPHLLGSLHSLLAEQDTVDPQFRCWITAEGGDKIPVSVLQRCIKVMVDTPRTMKENMVRAFSWVDADILKHSSRPEWPALLHNICYLHGALRLRARIGRGGWNSPSDFLKIGNVELFEALNTAVGEFKENLMTLTHDGNIVPRNASWTGIRFMLAEVIYGNHVGDPLDQLALNSMVDYWISPNAVKKEFELARLKYKHPAAFFTSHPRLTQLVQALENLPNHGLEVPEACNVHPSSETVLGDEQYVLTRMNKILDVMPSTATLSHQLFPRAPSPFNGPPMANISHQGNNPQVVDRGVFASASFAALKMRKEIELWEICHTVIANKSVHRGWPKDALVERIKRIGGFTSFNMFVMREIEMFNKMVWEIKSTLQAIKTACDLQSLGDQLTETQLQCADDLYHLRIPRYWCQLSGSTAPPSTQSLSTWLMDLNNRAVHLDKILQLGRERMPAYWLGAFFYPRGLLAFLKQDYYRHHISDRSGSLDQIVFQTEITARDKDHIRDPPAEGMFIFGIYVWGCAWEKTSGELVDSPPRQQCASLPVIHLTCWPQGEKPSLQDPAKAAETYPCPVYQSRIAPTESLLEIDLSHSGIPAARWGLRGLSATIRPY